jgi:ATP-dependent Lon protease
MKTEIMPSDPRGLLPLLPLKDLVFFPHVIMPVFISEDLCINAVEASLASDKRIFLSAFSVAGEGGAGFDSRLEPPFDVYDIGTVCTIMHTRRLPDGRMKVLVQGMYKGRVDRLVSADSYPLVDVVYEREAQVQPNDPKIEATIRAVQENLEKVVSLGKILSPDSLMLLEGVKEPGRLAYLISPYLGLKVHEGQAILTIPDPLLRLAAIHAHLSREIEVYQMQVKIQSQAKEEIGKMQREHYLREQIKVLKSELGDNDPKDELESLWAKTEEVKLTVEAKDEVVRQLRRLERMHQDTSEAALTRTHVETILSLPWEVQTDDNLELKNVNHVLDEDHYGLDQVKDRILEYLAVKKLNPAAKSPIICFVGPPGVGKTSLGRSIAKAMGRKFSRISLGGVRDEADVRGHRKTYVGAFPGRVIQSIKQAESSNPVIMLDEIDKLGSDHRGDPSAALLEVLDPEQNKNFVDHYIGLAYDLSKVMFIANANTLETIPPALRDRLEIIEVTGYSEEEKFAIANQFLIPNQIRENGLDANDIIFLKSGVREVIHGYTRESGLRNLEKQLASICRKVARQIAEDSEANKERKKVKVSPNLVGKLLGNRRYNDDFYHLEPTVGVALGMAYTQYGGEILAIETNLLPASKSNLVLTGQLGNVMKESAQAALSFIRAQMDRLGIDQKDFENHEIHIHFPAGAIPKDGPSAGIAIATAMISAFLKKAPAAKTCMTGEITLLGKVLAIGGLKEKILAAQREGLKHVILPEKNKGTFLALDANVKRGLTFSFVKEYTEVFEILFQNAKEDGEVLPLPRSVPAENDLVS